jgi:hypothetical protein
MIDFSVVKVQVPKVLGCSVILVANKGEKGLKKKSGGIAAATFARSG